MSSMYTVDMTTKSEAFSSIGRRRNNATARYPRAQDRTMYWGSGHARWCRPEDPVSKVMLTEEIGVHGDSESHVNCNKNCVVVSTKL